MIKSLTVVTKRRRSLNKNLQGQKKNHSIKSVNGLFLNNRPLSQATYSITKICAFVMRGP